MRQIGYKTPITAPSIDNVTIGNRLDRQAGHSLQIVQAGPPSKNNIGDQTSPLHVVPTGVRSDTVNDTMMNWLKNSTLATLYYGDVTTSDPEDEKYGLMYRHVKLIREGRPGLPEMGVPGVGVNFLTPEFWAYCKRKMDQEMETSYKLWKFQQIQLMSPAEREWWVRRTPDFVQALEAGKNRTLSILARIADIRIKGIQNEQDLRDLWEIGVGKYKPAEIIPPKNVIETSQFPGLSTESARSFPGVQLAAGQGTAPTNIV